MGDEKIVLEGPEWNACRPRQAGDLTIVMSHIRHILLVIAVADLRVRFLNDSRQRPFDTSPPRPFPADQLAIVVLRR